MNLTSAGDGRRRISILRAWDATLDWIDDRELARPLGSVAVLLLRGVGFLFLFLFLFLATRDAPCPRPRGPGSVFGLSFCVARL